MPQQSPSNKKRKFGSIQSSAARIVEHELDGNSNVAMKDLFRKKGDNKYSRSVKANPKFDEQEKATTS